MKKVNEYGYIGGKRLLQSWVIQNIFICEIVQPFKQFYCLKSRFCARFQSNFDKKEIQQHILKSRFEMVEI